MPQNTCCCCLTEAGVHRRSTHLAQFLLEFAEVLLASDMLVEQRIELGTGQQVLALQHGDDNIIREGIIGWLRVRAAKAHSLEGAGGVGPASNTVLMA